MARACRVSEWVTWRGRDQAKEIWRPGIYFIGKYPTAPSGLDIASKSIIYIGHTTRPIKYRLLKFHYSAFDAKDGRYGGRTFNVCAIGVYGKEPARSALIRLLERKYLYQFVQHNDRLPLCNKS